MVTGREKTVKDKEKYPLPGLFIIKDFPSSFYFKEVEEWVLQERFQ
jgi:hypothetical protein